MRWEVLAACVKKFTQTMWPLLHHEQPQWPRMMSKGSRLIARLPAAHPASPLGDPPFPHSISSWVSVFRLRKEPQP